MLTLYQDFKIHEQEKQMQIKEIVQLAFAPLNAPEQVVAVLD